MRIDQDRGTQAVAAVRGIAARTSMVRVASITQRLTACTSAPRPGEARISPPAIRSGPPTSSPRPARHCAAPQTGGPAAKNGGMGTMSAAR